MLTLSIHHISNMQGDVEGGAHQKTKPEGASDVNLCDHYFSSMLLKELTHLQKKEQC